ncbi:hypothetical protein KY290_005156 [Solanum tuberosum]|uniref:DUF7745 domain-containing protein n=1 Tax=Solanum tuberosum TaxID=4113 RepID=A0ABQ7WDB3_SOLTU|nr:hypothetical protein KY289_005550 [Solanum tuberosum]KAH0751891.1 hypothetical protein KY285_005039 [Solanum tuberosum]KAH0778729.1 hypothetical protein KY290_005156 [Solanum tuberosum]
MVAPNFSNTQMVVKANDLLKRWWVSIKEDHELEIRELLGGLTFLLFVAPDRYMIMALLKFYDPARLVFRFRDFELTPTLEKIGVFVNLPHKGRQMIVSHKQSPKMFLNSLGLKRNWEIDCLDSG